MADNNNGNLVNVISSILGELKAKLEGLDKALDKEENYTEMGFVEFRKGISSLDKRVAVSETKHELCNKDSGNRLKVIEKEIETIKIKRAKEEGTRGKVKKALPYTSGPGVVVLWETVIRPLIAYFKSSGGG